MSCHLSFTPLFLTNPNVGSTAGATSIKAKDTTIVAKKIDIEAGYDTYNGQTITKSKQSGLTIALDVPVVSQALALAESSKDVGKSKNDKVNAMAAANTAYKARELGKAAEILGKLYEIESFADTKIGVSVTAGSSKSKSTTTYDGTNAVSSTVAGERVILKATGDSEDVYSCRKKRR